MEAELGLVEAVFLCQLVPGESDFRVRKATLVWGHSLSDSDFNVWLYRPSSRHYFIACCSYQRLRVAVLGLLYLRQLSSYTAGHTIMNKHTIEIL